MADSVSKLREELMALTGIDIQLDEDTFKSTYQILKELSTVWNQLTDISKANVTELIAGKRGGNALNAVMSNFGIAESSKQTALDAEGYAQQELELVQQGIEYSVGRFKATFQELSADVIGSDLVKGVVDFGNLLITALDGAIDKFGALGTIIGGVAIAKGLSSFKALVTTISSLTGISGIPAITTAFSTLPGAIASSASAMGAFVASAAPILAVVAGVGLLVTAFNNLSQQASRSKDALNNHVQSYSEATTEVENLNTELEETQRKINELEAKDSLSLVEQSDLENLKKQNQELETSIRLAEAKQKLEARELANQASQTYKDWTTTNTPFFSESNAYDASKIANDTVSVAKQRSDLMNWFRGNTIGHALMSEANYKGKEDDINYLMTQYHNYLNAKKAAELEIQKLNQKDELDNFDEMYLGSLKEHYTEMDEAATTAMGHISNYADTMQTVYDSYSNYVSLGGVLNDVQKRQFTEASNFLRDYGIFMTTEMYSVGERMQQFLDDSTFDASGKIKDFVQNVKDGMTDVELELAIGQDGSLLNGLTQYGLSVGDLVRQIKSELGGKGLNIDSVRGQIQKMFTDKKYKINYVLGAADSNALTDFLEGKSDKEIEIFYKFVNENGVDLSTMSIDQLSDVFSEANNNHDAVADRFQGITEATEKVIENVTKVQDVLHDMTTGESISYDSFKEIQEMFSAEDIAKYNLQLENVNGTLKLNKDGIQALTEAKVDEAIADNMAVKMQKMLEYKKNAKEIEELKNATDDYNTSARQIADLESANASIISQCDAIDLLNAKLRESIGTYQAWKDAQNAGSYGDMAKDVRSAIQNINDAFDSSKGESYLRFGEQKYTASVDFLVPDSVSAEGQEAVQAYIKDLGTYFTGDQKGAQKFVGEAIEKGLMTVTETSDGKKHIEIAADTTMEMFAEQMGEHGFTMEAIQAMFGDLQTYLGEDAFQWEDMFTSSFQSAWSKLQLRLSKGRNTELELGADLSNLGKEEIQDYVSALETLQRQLKENPISDEYTNGTANALLEGEIERAKQALEEISKIEIDEGSISAFGEAVKHALLHVSDAVGRAIAKGMKDGMSEEEPPSGTVGEQFLENTSTGYGLKPVNELPDVFTVTEEQAQEAGESNAGLYVQAFGNFAKQGLSDLAEGLKEDVQTAVEDEKKRIQQNELAVSNLKETGGKLKDKFVGLGEHAKESVASAKNAIEPELEADSEREVEITITANDQASPVIEEVKEETEPLNETLVTEIEVQSNASEEISNIKDSINSVAETSEVEVGDAEATITADDEASEVVEGVQQKLNSYDGTTANATIDVTDNASNTISALKNDLDSLPTTKNITITTTHNTVGSVLSGGGGGHGFLNGTAHASGTAHRNGNWATTKDETALVGELGTEILVL